MNFKYLLTILCFGTVLFTGCEERQELAIPSEETNSTIMIDEIPVQIIDGLVHIPTRKALYALEGRAFTNRNSWISTNEFTSLSDHFDVFVKEFGSTGSDVEAMPAIPERFQAVVDVEVVNDTTNVDAITSWPVYAYLANSDAQLVVADELFTMITDGIVIIPLEDAEQYRNAPHLHPSAVTHSFNTRTIASTESLQKDEIGGCDNHWGPRRTGKRRVRGKIKSSTSLNGTIRMRIRTQCDRMNWFKSYFPEEADNMTLGGTLEFDSGGGETIPNEELEDVRHIERTFTNTGSITPFFGGGFHLATDFGSTRQCFSQPQFAN